jgi:hypothetical protein
MIQVLRFRLAASWESSTSGAVTRRVSQASRATRIFEKKMEKASEIIQRYRYTLHARSETNKPSNSALRKK